MLYHTYGGDTIRVGFIGPGKVGVNLGRYFTQKGIVVSGFYGRNSNHTKEAAKITNSKFYDNIQTIINDSDILFITTPDDNISFIDKKISRFDLKNKSVCHASGSLKSTELSNAKLSGASIYSIHPIFAFSNKNMNLDEFEKVHFSIEGDLTEEKVPILSLLAKLGNQYFIRQIEYSATYHLANVFVSNLVLSLLDIGTSYFKQMGLTEEQALNAIIPLVEGNIKNISEKGFVNSLTGPIARGDVKTVKKHLSVLKEEDKDLYQMLSLNLLKLVSYKENGGNVNENALSQLLKHSEKYSGISKLLGGLE